MDPEGKLILSVKLTADQGHTVQRSWRWFMIQRQALSRLNRSVEQDIASGTTPSVEHFKGLTLKEFRRAMDQQFIELQFLASFNMLSAAEATLWKKYKHYVTSKAPGELATALRKLDKRARNEIRNIDRVIDIWKEHADHPEKDRLSQFKGAMKYRHWIAHGRHFTAKAQQYTPVMIFDICNGVEKAVKA